MVSLTYFLCIFVCVAYNRKCGYLFCIVKVSFVGQLDDHIFGYKSKGKNLKGLGADSAAVFFLCLVKALLFRF